MELNVTSLHPLLIIFFFLIYKSFCVLSFKLCLMMVKCLAWYIYVCFSVINIGFYCLWASPKGFSLERLPTLSKKKEGFCGTDLLVMHFYIGYEFHLVVLIEFWLFTLPFFWLTVQGEVLTTIGFLKEAPQISFHGFNVYHKNRLILVSSWLLKK